MAATAAYNATIKIGGTATTFTNEATTEVEAGPPQIFQITDTAKQVLDPDTAVTIYNHLSVDVTSDFIIDYLTGQVTSATGGYSTITISGKYIPLHTVAEATAASINLSVAELDSSSLGNSYTELVPGKKTAEGEITSIAAISGVLDGGTLTWQSIFGDRSTFLLSVTFAGTLFRTWAKLLGIPAELPQDGLVTHNLQWKSVRREATDGTEVAFTITDE